MEQQMITLKEYADRRGLAFGTVYQWVRVGRLVGERKGHGNRIEVRDNVVGELCAKKYLGTMKEYSLKSGINYQTLCSQRLRGSVRHIVEKTGHILVPMSDEVYRKRIENRDDLRLLFGFMIFVDGVNLHPDDPVSEISDENGRPYYSVENAKAIQDNIDLSFDLFGEEVYEIAYPLLMDYIETMD